MLLKKEDYLVPGLAAGCPYRFGPGVNRFVAKSALGQRHDIHRGHLPTVRGESERRPGMPVASEPHMNCLSTCR